MMPSRFALVLCAMHGLVSLAACRGASQREDARVSQVYVSSDRGSTWQPAAVGLPAAALSISDLAAADSTLLLATKKDGIFLFDAATNRWQATPTSPRTEADVDAVAFYDGDLFAGTNGAGAWPRSEACIASIRSRAGPRCWPTGHCTTSPR